MQIAAMSESKRCGLYKNFKQATHDRLLQEMLRSVKAGDSKSPWRVLILDRFTLKIMSSSCKMVEIFEEGVSLVEDINKSRQSFLALDSIYFIQPTQDNVSVLLSDMAGKSPSYNKAFVFFSSPASKQLVAQIKGNAAVLPRIGALKEMNLEYLPIDGHGFVTGNERALEVMLKGELSYQKGDAYLDAMATRIATVFASVRELPFVTYRVAKSIDMDTVTTFHDLVPTKLAAGVWSRLVEYKSSIPDFPQTETCELLILDRSVDQIAPVIHDWTYEAMCHDLLNIEGTKYLHQVLHKKGDPPKVEEVLLDDNDPIWLDLKHEHIVDAIERLNEKLTEFRLKNIAAQVNATASRDGELSITDMRKVVQALPEYCELYKKLSLHVEIAGKINNLIEELGLQKLGHLEQDLVFGNAGTKEVLEFLRANSDTTSENKLRLLMIYKAIKPDKFDSDKGLKLMQSARLSADDLNVVQNLTLLEGSASETKKISAMRTLAQKLQFHRKKNAVCEEEAWSLSQFYPMIQELVEKLSRGELLPYEYSCMNRPDPTFHKISRAVTLPAKPTTGAYSVRTRRISSWHQAQNSDDGYSTDSNKMGKRIFVFIVGGATRSELRVCHKLSRKLRRELILGSSSIDSPTQFIMKHKLLAQELSPDDQ